jgi:hypothetical protein
MRRQPALARPPLRLPVATVLALLALAGLARAQRAPGGGGGLTLLPVPAAVVVHEGSLPIDEGFAIGFEGLRDPRPTRADERFLGRLQARIRLWSFASPMPPSEFRHPSSGLVADRQIGPYARRRRYVAETARPR